LESPWSRFPPVILDANGNPRGREGQRERART
jgi:hypothetical protein